MIPGLDLAELFLPEVFHMVIVQLNYSNPKVPLGWAKVVTSQDGQCLTVAWDLTWVVYQSTYF